MSACCFSMTDDAPDLGRPGSAQDAAHLRDPWRRRRSTTANRTRRRWPRAPETAELDGAVEQAGTGGDQDWRRWFQQTYRPIWLVDDEFVHRLNRDD